VLGVAEMAKAVVFSQMFVPEGVVVPVPAGKTANETWYWW